MLAYIPAPWILWLLDMDISLGSYLHFQRGSPDFKKKQWIECTIYRKTIYITIKSGFLQVSSHIHGHEYAGDHISVDTTPAQGALRGDQLWE